MQEGSRYGAARTASFLACICVFPAIGVTDPIYDRNTNVAVRERDHPEYDPLGVTVGVFRLFPKVASSVTYDDNIYGLSTKTGDFVLDVHPTLDVRSLWSRNDLRITLDYDADSYVAHGAQDTESYGGNMAGRLDVDRDSSIAVAVSAARDIQPRISQNSIAGVASPVRYDLVQGEVDIFRVFDRIRASARLNTLRYSYFNTTDPAGLPVQEDYQDHNELLGTARLDYAVSPATAFFLEGSANDHPYRRGPPLEPLRRDSHGYDALAGVDFQATHLIGGSVAIGYQDQRYDDPRFEGVNGLALRGRLQWYATPLITVTIGANRNFQDSGLPNVAAARFTEESLAVDYELLRSLILGARIFHQVYEYAGINGRDDRKRRHLGRHLSAQPRCRADTGVQLRSAALGRTELRTEFQRQPTRPDRDVRAMRLSQRFIVVVGAQLQ